MTQSFGFTDADLIARMQNFEDHFVERKTLADDKDWLKTVVAFANSAPIDFPCVLFIGVTNKGEIQPSSDNLDTLQQKLEKKLAQTYPRIAYFTRAIGEPGKQALAVIVPGSHQRPHFAGPPFVRRGTKTMEMSGDEYSEALAWRNSKAARILEYIGRQVTVAHIVGSGREKSWSNWPVQPFVDYCDRHYIILRQPTGAKFAYSLEQIQLSFDTVLEVLKIEIHN